MTFNATTGGSNPDSQVETLKNGSGCGAGKWSVVSDAKWLHVLGIGTIAAGERADVTVKAIPTNLAMGDYTGHLTFSANGSKPVIVAVTLSVQSSLCPQVDAKDLSFSGDVGANKRNPGAQTLTVANSCGHATVTAVAGAPWLTVSDGGGVGADGKTTLSVHAICLDQYNAAILKRGTYTAMITITITASDGTQVSAKVPVSFTVTQSSPATSSSQA